MLNFTTQLAVMIRAGITLRAALDGIADQTEHPKFHEDHPGASRQDVETGKQFSEALARHPKHLQPAVHQHGAGRRKCPAAFAKMLDRIAAYLAQQIETRAMVIGAMIYPGIIAHHGRRA